MGGKRGALVAAGLYAISGSSFAFGVQPLPTLFATALLVWGALLIERKDAEERAPFGMLGGGLLAASFFARASLLPAIGLALLFTRKPRRAAWAGAIGTGMILAGVFGTGSLPEGGGLNLRLGNGGERGGFAELRPGPRYERLRWEAVWSQPDDRPLEKQDAQQYALLADEVADDPGGALVTLLRKAHLFWHPPEIVSGADFRHGLREFAPAPALLWSFALVAPLALIGLLRHRPRTLLGPTAGVLLATVVYLTAARYRFPALPFLCAAAGLVVARPWGRREVLWLGAALLVVWPNWFGKSLLVPGDGFVQQGRMLLERDVTSEEARVALERALEVGADPRAAYSLGFFYQTRWRAQGDEADLERAVRAYRRALELEPDFPEAAENIVAYLKLAGHVDEARAEALLWIERIPRAGYVFLSLADILAGEGETERARKHAARGHQLIALRKLSQGALDSAAQHAREARRLGVVDARLDSLP